MFVYTPYIRQCDLKYIECYTSVNSVWNAVKPILTEIFPKHSPLIQKKVKSESCPWLTKEVKSLMNGRDKLFPRSKKTTQEMHVSACKHKRNAVNISARKAKANYFRSLLNENMKLPDKFWNILKYICPSKNTQTSHTKHFNSDGEVIADHLKISSSFSILCT